MLATETRGQSFSTYALGICSAFWRPPYREREPHMVLEIATDGNSSHLREHPMRERGPPIRRPSVLYNPAFLLNKLTVTIALRDSCFTAKPDHLKPCLTQLVSRDGGVSTVSRYQHCSSVVRVFFIIFNSVSKRSSLLNSTCTPNEPHSADQTPNER